MYFKKSTVVQMLILLFWCAVARYFEQAAAVSAVLPVARSLSDVVGNVSEIDRMQK